MKVNVWTATDDGKERSRAKLAWLRFVLINPIPPIYWSEILGDSFIRRFNGCSRVGNVGLGILSLNDFQGSELIYSSNDFFNHGRKFNR